jgi:GNAT superfamily N-acetyltransferase
VKDRLLSLVHFFRILCKFPTYVYRLVKTRGIRKAALHLASEFYSKKEFVITHHDLNSHAKITIPQIKVNIVELITNRMQEIDDICKVWPSEFGFWRPEHLRLKLIRDLENDNWCFYARSNGSVVGAVWVFKNDKILANCPVSHVPGERVVGRAFIVPQARGMGLSKLLYNHAVKVAIERGVPQLFGLTFPRRIASIKSKVSVGFKVVGTLKIKTCFGRDTYKFVSNTR